MVFTRKILNPATSSLIKFSCLILISLFFTACSSQPSRYALKNDTGPDRYVDHQSVANAVPRTEQKSRGGNKNYRVNGKSYRVLNSSDGYKQRGIASWYGKKFHGHRTSNGEIYDMYKMSAAHKSLPLPSYVRVTHLKNGKSVILRVNDRGPFHRNRLIDLSYVAAKKLGITATGTGVVEIEAINPTTFHSKKNNSGVKPQSSGHLKNRATIKSSLARTNSNYQVFLQVGAFSQHQNAESLQNRIGDLSLPYSTKVEFDASQNLYKVKLGPFASVDAADTVSETLYQHQIHKAYIVVD